MTQWILRGWLIASQKSAEFCFRILRVWPCVSERSFYTFQFQWLCPFSRVYSSAYSWTHYAVSDYIYSIGMNKTCSRREYIRVFEYSNYINSSITSWVDLDLSSNFFSVNVLGRACCRVLGRACCRVPPRGYKDFTLTAILSKKPEHISHGIAYRFHVNMFCKNKRTITHSMYE